LLRKNVVKGGIMKILSNQKGVSLIEILITIALVALITPMTTEVMLSAMKDYESGMRYINQQSDMNSAYSILKRDFEMAESCNRSR
jgi:type IV pilus assembly protein PilA